MVSKQDGGFYFHYVPLQFEFDDLLIFKKDSSEYHLYADMDSYNIIAQCFGITYFEVGFVYEISQFVLFTDI